MTQPNTDDPYQARAGMFRLLASAAVPDNPLYEKVLDETLNSPLLRDILNDLVGFALGAALDFHNGDAETTFRSFLDEQVTAKRLACVDVADFDERDGRTDDPEVPPQ